MNFAIRRTLIALVALLMTAVSFAPAHAEPSPELIEAAKREGRVVLYHGTSLDSTRGWASKFTEKYGIEVLHYRAPSYQVYERWLTETRAGRAEADVLLLTDPTILEDAMEQGLLAEYVPANDDGFDPNLRVKGYYYPMYVIPMAIAWNPELVTPEEEELIRTQGLKALADPRWRNRYATTMIQSGGSTYAWWYMLMEAMADEFGEDYLRALAGHNPDIYESKEPLYNRLVAGEYAISDGAVEGTLGNHYLRGAPIRWMFPDPAPATLTALAISGASARPNAARLFMEWATSVEAQEEWTNYGVAPAHRDARDTRAVTSEPWYVPAKNLYLDWIRDPKFVEDREKNFARWSEIFNFQP